MQMANAPNEIQWKISIDFSLESAWVLGHGGGDDSGVEAVIGCVAG